MPRPRQELVGFQRVHLKAGESRTIRLPVKAEALAYWDEQGNAWRLEPGSVKASIGSSSALTRLSTTIAVK